MCLMVMLRLNIGLARENGILLQNICPHVVVFSIQLGDGLQESNVLALIYRKQIY